MGALPPIQQLVSGRPSSCFGMQVVWSSAEEPEPVFVQSFQLGEGERAWLFVARYEIAGALFDGDSLGDGHVIEYFVVTGGPGTWNCARLTQHEDVVYSATLEPVGHVPTPQVDAASGSIGEPPHWISRTAAIWPTYAVEPMLFVGQVVESAPDAAATPLSGLAIYLFRSRHGDGRFALVTQDTSEQSTEEHYAAEDEFD